MSRHQRKTTPLQAAAVTAVSLAFVFAALFGLYRCISQPLPTPDMDEPEGWTGEDAAAGTPTGDPEDSPGSAVPAGRKEGFHTILLGGLDDANGGSDTNLLLALDTEKGQINVLSLPRDTLLNVPWSVKKLNNAFHHGGFSSTVEQVSRLLGIPVDHYVTVDLRGFVELVDAIDGVEFTIPVDMDYDDPYQDLHIHFPQGPRLLTGEEALLVLRWRQNNDGSEYPDRDLGRIATQQDFLMAVAEQMIRPENWDSIPALAEIAEKWVDTDLKLANLIWLGEQALTIGSDNITFHTLPGDGAGYYKGVSYYVADPDKTLELINSAFNPLTRELTGEDLDIPVP